MNSTITSKWSDLLIEHEKWDFFKDQKGMWRWIKTNEDGITIGSSPEAYNEVEDCVLNATRYGYFGDMDTILFIPDCPESEAIFA